MSPTQEQCNYVDKWRAALSRAQGLQQAVDRLERERDELRRAVEDRRDRTAARPDLFGDQAYAYSAVLDMIDEYAKPDQKCDGVHEGETVMGGGTFPPLCSRKGRRIDRDLHEWAGREGQ